jgi:hypothetical protein
LSFAEALAVAGAAPVYATLVDQGRFSEEHTVGPIVITDQL